MHRTRAAAGGLLATAGVVGYGLGIVEPYAGRAFSVTAVIVGTTLLAVSGGGGR